MSNLVDRTAEIAVLSCNGVTWGLVCPHRERCANWKPWNGQMPPNDWPKWWAEGRRDYACDSNYRNFAPKTDQTSISMPTQIVGQLPLFP